MRLWMMAAAALMLSITSAAADRERNPADLIGKSVQYRMQLAGSERFQPIQIVVLTLDGALAATPPRRGEVIDYNRVSIGPAPLVGDALGGLFGRAPGAAAVTPERRLGGVYRLGDILIIDLAGAPVDAPALLAQPVSLIGREFRETGLEIAAPLRFRPADHAVPAELRNVLGRPIGGAYLAGDLRSGRLVIAPPRSAFEGL